jgi:hypothetical protein
MEGVASSSNSGRRLLRTPGIEYVNMRGEHRYSGRQRVKGPLPRTFTSQPLYPSNTVNNSTKQLAHRSRMARRTAEDLWLLRLLRFGSGGPIEVIRVVCFLSAPRPAFDAHRGS